MSSRTMTSSLPKSASASVRASSVFPTPVGPRKRKLPSGRFGSASPARARGAARPEAPAAPARAAAPGRRRGSGEPGAGAADGLRDGLDRLVLADDPLVEPLLELQEPVALLL